MKPFKDFDTFKAFFLEWYPGAEEFSDKELFLHHVWYEITVSKTPDFLEFFPGEKVYRKKVKQGDSNGVFFN